MDGSGAFSPGDRPAEGRGTGLAAVTQVDAVHTFAGGNMDRASHLRSDAVAVRDMLAAPDTRFLPFRNLEPLLAGDVHLAPAWQTLDRVEPLLAAGAVTAFLGLREGARFVLDVPRAPVEAAFQPSSAAYTGVRRAALRLSAADASLVALGRSLLAWHTAHGFCPHCGIPTEAAEAGHQRRCTDPSCSAVQFPRTDPVVIMLVHREGRVLLGRAVREHRYPPGLFSCLAGYVEPGESIEEAVRREVREEAGMPVGCVRYHSSQPWPFPSTLMIGCFAEALAEAIHPDPTELEDARWFTSGELQQAVERWSVAEAVRLPPPLTIAHQLAKAWLADRSDPPR